MVKPLLKGRPRGGRQESQAQRGHPPAADIDKLRQKKLHHLRKQLHQALKKARQFEVRKIVRRLKESSSSSEPGAAAQKLQHQLEAAKGLSIEVLAEQVAAACEGGSAADAPAQQQELSQAAALVRTRVVAAKCVQEAVAAAHAELAQLQAEAAARAEAARRAVAEEAVREGHSGEPEAEAQPMGGDVSSGDDEGDMAAGRASSSGESSQDEGDIAAKRRLLLGGGEPGPVQAQASAQPKPPPVKRKKKNRLGQRARKKLAAGMEQPGQLQQQRRPLGAGRSAGSAPQRPARGPAQKPPQLQRPPAPAKGAKPALVRQAGGSTAAQTAALHPSWAAKKALADKAAHLAKPQGTKTVFSDDE